MTSIDKDKFVFLYQNANGLLSDSQKDGLRALIEFFGNDDQITDIRHTAYMLATVRHECAGTWQPIEESGKGQGREYGNPDTETGQAYYGRGYVQLTWKANYKDMSVLTKLDLVNHPEQALNPDVAYTILSFGMRRGAFTGVALRKYINESGCDYVGARRIINGTDCAMKIAGYAEEFEAILKECLKGALDERS